MATLHSAINALASEFAHDLLRALRGASLNEIVTERSTGHVRRRATRSGDEIRSVSRKRVRRSPETLKTLADQIIAIVAKHPKGIRAEELKAAMGVKPGNVGAKVFSKPLSIALASKKIRKRGHRRATTYFAARGTSAIGSSAPTISPAQLPTRMHPRWTVIWRSSSLCRR